MNNKKLPFLRKLESRNTYSQACQDIFVLDMLKEKKQGFYLEVGASHPFESNNTFLLEDEYEWRGISVEIDEYLADEYNQERRNICYTADAITFDYQGKLSENNFPHQIDYLSLDIEPAENTYKALLALPMSTYRFSVITYEHESYVAGDKYMNMAREYLKGLNYQLVVGNVKSRGRDFEDWWIDPAIIPEEVWKLYHSSDIEFKDVFTKKRII
jgi:hypothetical protein